MTRDQLKTVFKILANVYPNFEVSSEKLDIWHEFLKDQDYDVVLERVKTHVKEKKFPPTIADLREQQEKIPPYYDEFVYDINAGENWV